MCVGLHAAAGRLRHRLACPLGLALAGAGARSCALCRLLQGEGCLCKATTAVGPRFSCVWGLQLSRAESVWPPTAGFSGGNAVEAMNCLPAGGGGCLPAGGLFAFKDKGQLSDLKPCPRLPRLGEPSEQPWTRPS